MPGGNSMIDVLRNRAAYIRVSLPVSDDRRRDLALGEARSYQASFSRAAPICATGSSTKCGRTAR